MGYRALLVVLVLCLSTGCVHPKGKVPAVNFAVAPYEQFVARNFDWSMVRRVVLMPLSNQTAYPKVVYELQANLAAEFQRTGRFEVVVASREDQGAMAHDVFTNGQFNEIDLLRVAREYEADAVMFANVTQYHPYSRPRVGLSLVMISPAEGISIASISGLWDAREASTSAQALAYFKQTQAWPRSLMGADRVFESPDVFQRFVCQQVATSLVPSGANPGSITTTIPTEMVLPVDGSVQDGMDIPAFPPPPLETP